MKAFVEKIGNWVRELIIISVVAVVGYHFLKYAVAPASPVAVTIFIIVCTAITFSKWTTTIPVTVAALICFWSYDYGSYTAVLLWPAGVLMWFAAVYFSIKRLIWMMGTSEEEVHH